MTENPIKAYKRVLHSLNQTGRAKKRFRWDQREINDAMLMEMGIIREDTAWRHLQNMVRMGYLLPGQCGPGVMAREYEMGEAALKMLSEEEKKERKVAS